MKSLQFLKIVLVLYFTISMNVIECIQVTKTKHHLLKAQKIKSSLKKYTVKANAALYAKIAQQYKTRDESMSVFKDVNDQMLACWQQLKEDGTTEVQVNDCLATLITKTQAHLDTAKGNSEQEGKIDKELQSFMETFNEAWKLDKQIEESLTELESQKAEQTKVENQSGLSDEEKEAKLDILEREKFNLQNSIIEGKTDLLRIFTDFTHNKKDEETFAKRTIKALENSLPDKFCYKQGGDLAPTQKKYCPSTHPIKSLLDTCIETCEQGQLRKRTQLDSKFTRYAAVCWEQCNTSKQPKCVKSGLIIYPTNSWTNWHWQRSFIPSFRTVFSKEVSCAEGQIKWGFLCYSRTMKCENIGYQSCGPAACAVDSSNCAKVIADMVLSTITGICKFALLFVAPGAANVLQTAVTVLGNVHKWSALVLAMIASRDYMLQAYKNTILRERMIKSAVSYMIKNKYNVVGSTEIVGKQLTDRITDAFEIQTGVLAKDKEAGDKSDQKAQMDNFYKTGTKHIVKEAVNSVLKEATTGILKEVGQEAMKAGAFKSILGQLKCFNFQAVEYVINAVDTCGVSGNEVKGVDCARNVLGAISQFDPTGLTGIARAFMYNKCPYTEDM